MDMDLQARWTERWEGRRHTAYDDATGETLTPGKTAIGNPTIGVGTNLNDAQAAIEALGLDYEAVKSGAVSLTDAQIDQLLAGTLQTAVSEAHRLFPAFDSYPANPQLVITDLCFNMGEEKLATFTHTCAAIKAQNWTEAAAQLKDSAWFHEVGSDPFHRGWSDVAVLGGSATPEFILSN